MTKKERLALATQIAQSCPGAIIWGAPDVYYCMAAGRRGTHCTVRSNTLHAFLSTTLPFVPGYTVEGPEIYLCEKHVHLFPRIIDQARDHHNRILRVDMGYLNPLVRPPKALAVSRLYVTPLMEVDLREYGHGLFQRQARPDRAALWHLQYGR